MRKITTMLNMTPSNPMFLRELTQHELIVKRNEVEEEIRKHVNSTYHFHDLWIEKMEQLAWRLIDINVEMRKKLRGTRD